jgi:glutaminyl-peptide cyclotransferase
MSLYRTNLNQISLFVLLDLLGSQNPIIPSYFPTTHWAYKNMANVEKRMRAMRLLKSSPNHSSKRPKNSRPTKEPMFLSEVNKGAYAQWMGGGIEDDHIPFMKRGVPVLHMIPNPFPEVWHTMEDDGPHLDMPTVEDWAKIVTGFTAEWLELDEYMPSASNSPRSVPSRTEGFLEEDEWESYDLARRQDEL